MDAKDIQVAERFSEEVKALLSASDDALKEFMEYFDDGQYRKAYLFLEEVKKGGGYVSDKFKLSMATQAFELTAFYDKDIKDHFTDKSENNPLK